MFIMYRLKTAWSSLLVVFFTFLLFSLCNVNEVKAQDSTATSAITEVNDFKASDYDKEKAYLFVQDGSEASKTVLDYINSVSPEKVDYFTVNVVNVPRGGNIYEEFAKLYRQKCYFSEILVPTFLYKDVCTVGVDDITLAIGSRFTLEAENIDLKASIKEADDYLEESIQAYNKEIASMTLIDYVNKINIVTLILLIIVIILIVVSFVVILFFRNKFDYRKRRIVLGAQVFLIICSLGYLTFKVNSIKSNYSPLRSSAGDCRPNCATYEDLMNARAEHGNEEEQRIAAKYEEQKKKDEELFGSNASHLNQTPPEEQTLYPTLVNNLKQGDTVTIGGVTYTWNGSSLLNSSNKPVSMNTALEGVRSADQIKVNTGSGSSTTPVNQTSLDQYVANTGSKEAAEVKERVMEEALNKALRRTITECTVNGKVVDCSSNVYCQMPDGTSACIKTQKSVVRYCIMNGKVVDCNSHVYCQMPDGTSACEKLSADDYTYRYDAKTQTAVLVPTGKTSVDPCEPGTVGSNVRAPILCNCGNYWTTAVTGTCDQICRVENLICDTCNEPPSEPPVIPPPTPGVPYCGDGILGNTTGEKCEFGDPTGVSCSWNVCNNVTCTCPTVTAPFCGDGIINVAGEQCEVGDPSGTTCKWDTCNRTTCKCITPGCGDGTLDAGEQCEKGDPTGTTCKWDTCNQLKCECIEPGCGDGKLDTGEQCEKNNPTGVSCLWEECSKSTCDCEVKVSEYCGDGKLQEGEQCEEGNPSGTTCSWDKCSKATCLCPSTPGVPPKTGIFDNAYLRNVVLGATMLILGVLFYPTTKFIDSLYITMGNRVLKLGRYVIRNGEIRRTQKKKNIEERFK